MMQLPWSTVNGVESSQVVVHDRGLQYGDGLFETLLLSQGNVVLGEQHLQRLTAGLHTLGITITRNEIERHLSSALQHLAQQRITNALIKLIVTRDASGRGYAPDRSAGAICIIIVYPAPRYARAFLNEGVAVALCQQSLPNNSPLGGLKHLNRLAQVLAANEWMQRGMGYAEGLLLDDIGNVIEGTFSNIWLIEGDRAVTPITAQSGVRGVMCDYLANTVFPKMNIAVERTTVKLDRLLMANEIFVCNSVYGVWPIKSLEVKQYASNSIAVRTIAAIGCLGYDALYH